MKKKRGKTPNKNTMNLLCAHSAGRCQFEGCNKRLYKDSLTQRNFSLSNFAHIIASSPDGPRGDKEESEKLSDNVDNLMLLCYEHHKMIDSEPNIYTVEKLREMKIEHELKIAEQCDLLNREKTELIRLTSPIKGEQEVSILYEEIAEAVSSRKRVNSMRGITISVTGNANYSSQKYWREAERIIREGYENKILSTLREKPNLHFSIFPIAPIPMISKLGYLIGDKMRVDIYQKKRTPSTWKWESEERTNRFDVEIIEEHKNSNPNKVAIALSLTGDILKERIMSIDDFEVIYFIKAERKGVDCIKSEVDLSEFWHKYQEVCDVIIRKEALIEEVSLFPAIPASAAFEIGRRYMKGVYPKIKIYDENNGFFETLSIGG